MIHDPELLERLGAFGIERFGGEVFRAMADRRLRHPQTRRGVAESPVHRGGVKGAQRRDRRQRKVRLDHARKLPAA